MKLIKCSDGLLINSTHISAIIPSSEKDSIRLWVLGHSMTVTYRDEMDTKTFDTELENLALSILTGGDV